MSVIRIKGSEVIAEKDGRIIMRTTIKKINPLIAEECLRNNPNNRKLNRARVRQIAEEMKRGEWRNNGESIVINDRGELVDGQHRLNAIIESGKEYIFNFSTVATEEANFYDLGLSRSVRDIITMSGNEPLEAINSPKVTAAMAFLIRRTFGRDALLKSTIVKELERNYDVFKFIVDTGYVSTRGGKRGFGKSSVIGGLAAAYKAGYPEYKLKQFIDVLADGIMRSNEDITIIKFREWLARNEVRADMNKSVPGEEEYLKLQATLKAYEEGRILQKAPRGKTEYYKFYEGTYKI